MNREQTAEKIIAIISGATDIPAEEIALQSDLLGDIDMSSLEIMTIFSEMEKSFNVQIPIEDLYEIAVVDDLVNCVQKQLEAKG